MLERLYHKLDDVAHEFKVFKVETIGDSYMAVANLIEPQPDHAARIADFAMEVLPPLLIPKRSVHICKLFFAGVNSGT